MKSVSIIGIGKLGLCLGLNLENSGYNVIGIDVNEEYINDLNNNNFQTSEPSVNRLLSTQKNIKFTTDIQEAFENDIVFIVVSTPSTHEWKYDHSNIDNVVNKLLELGVQKKRKDLIINCTTFPGYCEELHNRTKDYNVHVSYNPEFIAQGSIIKDQLYADHVLIGGSDEYASNLIEKVYMDFMVSEPIFNKLTPVEAEITKLSVNCFLTTKISYANMIGDITIRYGGDPNNVLDAIGSDHRIGNKYLGYGYGFGGPCFPRDNRALLKCAEEVGVNAVISKSTDEMNDLHLQYQIEEFVRNNPNKGDVVFDYVTYKKDSTILEESQRLKFALELQKLGYNVIVKEERDEIKDTIKNIFTK
jgi:nucleotide sugar dehydrogenase